jgi:hypothetical protein
MGATRYSKDNLEKPSGNRETLTLNHVGVEIQSPTKAERDGIGEMMEKNGNEDPMKVSQLVDDASDQMVRRLWDKWMGDLLSHRQVPVPLFSTETVQQSGHSFTVVKKDVHGNSERPVLKMSQRARNHVRGTALTICIQQAVGSDDTPHEIAEQIPYDVQSYDIMRIRDFIDDWAWVKRTEAPWWDRAPISPEHQQEGIAYVMYNVRGEEVIPRYIGISLREGADGLAWPFRNAHQDSVMTRWGYGQGQHLGELSCAMWPDDYRWSPKPKYRRWLDGLFVDQSRVLREPVYLELLPWTDCSPVQSEENLVRCASELYSDEVLNVEYND